jgi:hypothetical protein
MLHDAPQIFEAVMLVCFGASWPVAILKTWRTRRVDGKSLLFLVLILVGYLAGISAKMLYAAGRDEGPQWVTWLYALNAAMVSVEIGLYVRFWRPGAG